jgi:copper transport protein
MQRGVRAIARVAALFTALLIAVALPSSAHGHAALVKAVPADGAVDPAGPQALTLTFNEPVSPLLVHLIGPDGEPIETPAAVAENTTLTVAVPSQLKRGTHVLSWRVISADGHPVGGSLVFSVGAPSAQPAAGAESLAGRGVRAALWAAKLVIYAGLFVGVGGAFFRAWLGYSGAAAADPAIAAILVAALVALPLSLGLQGLDALDLPLASLSHRAVWEAGLETSFGLTVIVATFALFAGLLALAATAPFVRRLLSLAALVGAGAALALSGHASTIEPRLLSRSAVLVHALCVAFWIGSLLPLYAAVRRTASPGPPPIATALARFSRAIVPVIVVLIISGLWLIVVQLDHIEALWTTSYGQVLAGKLACVALLLGLGAVNRYRLVPRFIREGAPAARPFAASLAVELAIALAIFALVALWRFTPPPRTLVSDAPISLHLHGDKAMAEIEIERRGGGPARANVLVLDGAFRPMAAKEVVLVLANPDAGIEPLRRVATAAGESRWLIDDLRIPVAGRWTLGVDILVSDFEKVMLEDAVNLPRVP